MNLPRNGTLPGGVYQPIRAIVPVVVALGLASPLAAEDSEVEKLRAELEAMKQAHAESIRALENRIRLLEEESAPVPAPVAVAEPAAQDDESKQAHEYARQQFERDTESRDHALLSSKHPYADRVEEMLQGYMDIHGGMHMEVWW